MTRLAAWRPWPGRFCSSSSSRTRLTKPARSVASDRCRHSSTGFHLVRRAIDEHRLIVILRSETLWPVGIKELGDPHVQVVPPLQRRPGPVHPQAEASDRRRLRAYRGPPRRSATGLGVAITFGDGSAASLSPAQKELPDTASASSSQTRRQLKPAGDFPDGPRRHQHPATGGGAGPRGNRGPARVGGELAHQRRSGLAAVCHFAKSILRLIEFPIATYPASLGCRWSPLS